MKKTLCLLLAILMFVCTLSMIGCSDSSTNSKTEEPADLLAAIQQRGEIIIAMEGTWAPWTSSLRLTVGFPRGGSRSPGHGGRRRDFRLFLAPSFAALRPQHPLHPCLPLPRALGFCQALNAVFPQLRSECVFGFQELLVAPAHTSGNIPSTPSVFRNPTEGEVSPLEGDPDCCPGLISLRNSGWNKIFTLACSGSEGIWKGVLASAQTF